MSVLNGFIDGLRAYLEYEKLPGKKAQFRMAPELRKESLTIDYDLNKAVESSVLILLFPENNCINTVLILRPKYDGVHSGQIAFPGGKFENGDKDLIDTARREAFEEIGVNGSIEVLGTLTDLYIPPSNFLVKPVVAFSPIKPNFVINHDEVDKLITVRLDDFFNGNILKIYREFELSNQQKVSAPCYMIANHYVWGATAMIISELIEVLKES